LHAAAAAALCALAGEHGVFVAGSVLERHSPSGHVVQSLLVARPDGLLHPGASAKMHPAHFERFVFASGSAAGPQRSARVLEVDGLLEGGPVRLGVSICNDSYQPGLIAALAAAQPDLILAPHCAMVPEATLGLSQAERDAFRRSVVTVASMLARFVGVPTVSTNATGPWASSEFLPFVWRSATSLQLRGAKFAACARVVSGSGATVAVEGEHAAADLAPPSEARAVVGDVVVWARRQASEQDDLQRRLEAEPSLRMPAVMRAFRPVHEGVGAWWYQRNLPGGSR
jgi:predicted amidohydrolase